MGRAPRCDSIECILAIISSARFFGNLVVDTTVSLLDSSVDSMMSSNTGALGGYLEAYIVSIEDVVSSTFGKEGYNDSVRSSRMEGVSKVPFITTSSGVHCASRFSRDLLGFVSLVTALGADVGFFVVSTFGLAVSVLAALGSFLAVAAPPVLDSFVSECEGVLATSTFGLDVSVLIDLGSFLAVAAPSVLDSFVSGSEGTILTLGVVVSMDTDLDAFSAGFVAGSIGGCGVSFTSALPDDLDGSVIFNSGTVAAVASFVGVDVGGLEVVVDVVASISDLVVGLVDLLLSSNFLMTSGDFLVDSVGVSTSPDVDLNTSPLGGFDSVSTFVVDFVESLFIGTCLDSFIVVSVTGSCLDEMLGSSVDTVTVDAGVAFLGGIFSNLIGSATVDFGTVFRVSNSGDGLCLDVVFSLSDSASSVRHLPCGTLGSDTDDTSSMTPLRVGGLDETASDVRPLLIESFSDSFPGIFASTVEEGGNG